MQQYAAVSQSNSQSDPYTATATHDQRVLNTID